MEKLLFSPLDVRGGSHSFFPCVCFYLNALCIIDSHTVNTLESAGDQVPEYTSEVSRTKYIYNVCVDI